MGFGSSSGSCVSFRSGGTKGRGAIAFGNGEGAFIFGIKGRGAIAFGNGEGAFIFGIKGRGVNDLYIILNSSSSPFIPHPWWEGGIIGRIRFMDVPPKLV